jgi:hypothetical protein
MEKKYVLLEYDYLSYCQGTADRGHGFALVHVPISFTLFDAKDFLMQCKNRSYDHEINYDSIEDATLEY